VKFSNAQQAKSAYNCRNRGIRLYLWKYNAFVGFLICDLKPWNISESLVSGSAFYKYLYRPK
jgi:hypothetical protein